MTEKTYEDDTSTAPPDQGTSSSSSRTAEFAHLFLIGPDTRSRLYETEQLRLLAKMKHKHRAGYEELRDQLRKAKVPDLIQLDRQVDREIKKQLGKLADRKAEKAVAEALNDGDGTVIDYDTPLVTALQFAKTRKPTLMRHNDDWLEYRDSHYVELEDKTVQQAVSRFLDSAKAQVTGKDGKVQLEKVKQNPRHLTAIVDMLAVDIHKEKEAFSPPCWLEPQEGDPPASEIVACRNGLLHLETRTLLKPTSRFFTRNALPFDYDPGAPKPTRWLQFLEEVWPASEESIKSLQQIFGYLLTADTSQQKIFLVIGPSRGGKGTILRIVRKLIGEENCASQTLRQMGRDFGMQSMIGKTLLTVTDAYQKGVDSGMVAENLLRISGEDSVTISRKFKQDWQGTLSTRILMAATMPPVLPDQSGSLPNRYVPLVSRESFAGREDPDLTRKLEDELPGILNWAIGGWHWHCIFGGFNLTEDGKKLVDEIRLRANAVDTFVRQYCEFDPDARIAKNELFEAYKRWTKSVDAYIGSKSDFGRKLVAASGNRVVMTRPRTGQDGTQEPHYGGILLNDAWYEIEPSLPEADNLFDDWDEI